MIKIRRKMVPPIDPPNIAARFAEGTGAVWEGGVEELVEAGEVLFGSSSGLVDGDGDGDGILEDESGGTTLVVRAYDGGFSPWSSCLL